MKNPEKTNHTGFSCEVWKSEKKNKAKEPLLLLHGLMGAKRHLGQLARMMSQDRDVWVFDQRGHGETYLNTVGQGDDHDPVSKLNRPSSGWTIDLLGEDLKSLSDSLELERFHLLGHSMGGRVALRFSKQYPEKILSLMVLDTSPKLSSAVARFIESILDKTPVPFQSRADAKNYLQEAFEDKAFSQFLYTNLKEIKPGKVNWSFDTVGMKALIRNMVAEPALKDMLSCPAKTLLLRGENSTHFLAKDEKFLREHPQLPPSLQIKTLAGAGHMLHSDKPKELFEILQDFLEAIETL